MISSWIASRRSLFEQVIEVHPRPQPRDERVAALGVLERDRGAETHRLAAARAGDDDLAGLIACPRADSGRAGSAACRPARSAGSPDRRGPCAGRGTRPSDRAAPAGRSRRAVPARRPAGACSPVTLPHRAAAERRDRLEDAGLVAAAERDGVERAGLARSRTAGAAAWRTPPDRRRRS